MTGVDNHTDEFYMQIALEEANKGWGRTNPNPLVGAVVVKDGRIVGKGFHEQAGMPHAEVVALRNAGDESRGATMYVTLEPCNHHGRTPPCTDAIIRAGIRRVVIAVKDPNPIAKGGAVRLKDAGIQVDIGVLADDAVYINEPFLVSAAIRRPYVFVKTALSMDGFIATNSYDSGQLFGGMSGSWAKKFVHKWRARLDAIMVGANTIIKDNPRLSARGVGDVLQPTKIILDANLQIPIDSAVFDSSDAPTIVFAKHNINSMKIDAIKKVGADVVLLEADNSGLISPKDILNELWRRKIYSVMIEGGGGVVGSFISANLIDRFVLIYTPYIFGSGIPFAHMKNPPQSLKDALHIQDIKVLHAKDDVVIWAKPDL